LSFADDALQLGGDWERMPVVNGVPVALDGRGLIVLGTIVGDCVVLLSHGGIWLLVVHVLIALALCLS